MKDLETVVKESDIITIHVPLMEQTKNMINGKKFFMMKDKCFLINTSRAEIIDEQALINYFNEGKFRGIALDVYSENLKLNLKRDNVIFTPHIAAQGEDSFEEMCSRPINELLKKL